MPAKNPGWRELIGLPEAAWSSAAELRRVLQCVGGILEPNDFQPNRMDKFWDAMFSLAHIGPKRVIRALTAATPPDNGKIKIVLLGNGFLRPGRIVRSGILQAPLVRRRAKELFGMANIALGFDLFTFHTQFGRERDPGFVAELLADGLTNREWIANTGRLYPPDQPALHFSLLPMAVLGLLEAVLLTEPLLQQPRLREVEFLPLSSGILAAAHFSAGLPFTEICEFICQTLAPLTHDYERRSTRQYLAAECGAPAALLNGNAPFGEELCRALGPGMLAVVGFRTAFLAAALQRFRGQTGADVELTLRMGTFAHILSGLKPHLAACMQFLKREKQRRPSYFFTPVRYRLLPVFHGSHHTSYRPVREQARPALEQIFARNQVPQKLKYAICSTSLGAAHRAAPRDKPARNARSTQLGSSNGMYQDREILLEEILNIIDQPVDMFGSYKNCKAAGDCRFVFATCAAADFSVGMVKKSILDAHAAWRQPRFLDLNHPETLQSPPPAEFTINNKQ